MFFLIYLLLFTLVAMKLIVFGELMMEKSWIGLEDNKFGLGLRLSYNMSITRPLEIESYTYIVSCRSITSYLGFVTRGRLKSNRASKAYFDKGDSLLLSRYVMYAS